MRDAQVHKMLHTCVARHANCLKAGPEIDIDELRCLGGTRMRNTYQLHESVCACYGASVRVAIQRVPDDGAAPCGHFRARLLSTDGKHFMPALREERDQSRANVSRSAGNKHAILASHRF